MSELIPGIDLGDFLKLKTSELKQLKSCEVTSGGKYLFTFVNPQTDYIRVQTEYLSQQSNSVGGKALEEILESANAPV